MPAKDDEMPLAFSYVRFSTPKQADGDSLRRQTEIAQAYAAAHGLMLDGRSFQDLGVSAFSGKNRTEGALGAFLSAVESGRVPRGSVLLVESLDRLSREEVEEALTLFLTIIRAGIKIITLADGMEFEKGKLDLGKLVLAISFMARGNNESSTKRFRLTAKQKQNHLAIAEGEHARIRTPGWLQSEGKRFTFRPDRAKIVRDMVAAALAGKSTVQIKHDLNARNVETFAHAKRWASSSIHYILTNPALIGEFHPVSGREPKANYFPALIDVATYRKLLAALSNRYAKPAAPSSRIVQDETTGEMRVVKSRGRNGGRRKSEINLFTGLLQDANGERWHAKLRGNAARQNRIPYLVSELKANVGQDVPTFPYYAFEGAVLAFIEIDPALVNGRSMSAEKRELDALRDELTETTAKIAETTARIDAGKNFSSLLTVLERLEERKAVLIRDIARLDRVVSGVEANDVAAVKDALALLERGEGNVKEIRDKLRVMLRGLVDRIQIQVFEMTVPNVAKGGTMAVRYCVVELCYAVGTSRKIVLRSHREHRTSFMLDSVWHFGKETDWQKAIGRPVDNDFFERSAALAERVEKFYTAHATA
jgi:DNA invertase Pin-like site-specific DNA recombinase